MDARSSKYLRIPRDCAGKEISRGILECQIDTMVSNDTGTTP